MHELYRELYGNFTVKRFHEHLVRRHGYKLGYTVTRLSLQAAGLVAKAKRCGAHRKKRIRRPLPGMLLFQDASTYRCIAALGRDLDLVATRDDAAGKLYSAILVEAGRHVVESFMGLAETITGHGRFGAHYTDRGSHYFITPKGGGMLWSDTVHSGSAGLSSSSVSRSLTAVSGANEGRLKISEVPTRRYAYYLTPTGLPKNRGSRSNIFHIHFLSFSAPKPITGPCWMAPRLWSHRNARSRRSCRDSCHLHTGLEMRERQGDGA